MTDNLTTSALSSTDAEEVTYAVWENGSLTKKKKGRTTSYIREGARQMGYQVDFP